MGKVFWLVAAVMVLMASVLMLPGCGGDGSGASGGGDQAAVVDSIGRGLQTAGGAVDKATDMVPAIDEKTNGGGTALAGCLMAAGALIVAVNRTIYASRYKQAIKEIDANPKTPPAEAQAMTAGGRKAVADAVGLPSAVQFSGG